MDTCGLLLSFLHKKLEMKEHKLLLICKNQKRRHTTRNCKGFFPFLLGVVFSILKSFLRTVLPLHYESFVLYMFNIFPNTHNKPFLPNFTEPILRSLSSILNVGCRTGNSRYLYEGSQKISTAFFFNLTKEQEVLNGYFFKNALLI